MLTEKSFDSGEFVMNFAEGGADGPPLVLLHGVTLNWETLGGIIPALEKNWHIYACDFRGHGKSGRAASGYRIVNYGRDVALFIERYIRQPTVVVGFSLGAMVAIHTAARHPSLVRAVISLEPGLILRDTAIRAITNSDIYLWLTQDFEMLTHPGTVGETAARVRQRFPGIDDDGVQFQVNRLKGLDPAAVACLLEDQLLDDFDLEQAIGQVTCPTLLVYGEHGQGGLVRDSDAALLKTHIPHARVAQIMGSGHDVIFGEFGVQTMGHMSQFLESLDQ